MGPVAPRRTCNECSPVTLLAVECGMWDARIKFLKSHAKEAKIWLRAVKIQKDLWTCRKEAALKKLGGNSSLRLYSGICTSDDTA